MIEATMTNIQVSINKINEKKENKEDIYSKLYFLKKATAKEIWESLDKKTKWLNQQMRDAANDKYENGEFTTKEKDEYIKKNIKTSMHIRTIQRHLKEDQRIVKDGRYYLIHNNARFEVRYLKPDTFGFDILREMGFILKDNSKRNGFEKNVKECITSFGAFVFFIFIEAVRPFEDPSVISPFERNDLVEYWARNAIPVNRMFQKFRIAFAYDDYDDITKVKNLPTIEFSRAKIRRLLRIMKKLYPELYARLSLARERSPWYPSSKEVTKSLMVHGKSLEKLPHKKRGRVD